MKQKERTKRKNRKKEMTRKFTSTSFPHTHTHTHNPLLIRKLLQPLMRLISDTVYSEQPTSNTNQKTNTGANS